MFFFCAVWRIVNFLKEVKHLVVFHTINSRQSLSTQQKLTNVGTDRICFYLYKIAYELNILRGVDIERGLNSS